MFLFSKGTDAPDISVYRGGVSASMLWPERTEVRTEVYSKTGYIPHLVFDFTIASKGGGRTQIQLCIRQQGLERVLKELAEKLPTLAPAFAEATQIAISKLTSAKE